MKKEDKNYQETHAHKGIYPKKKIKKQYTKIIFVHHLKSKLIN